MDHPYRTRSRKLFRLWTEHDLSSGPFREISIKAGKAVELEVPAFITDLIR